MSVAQARSDEEEQAATESAATEHSRAWDALSEEEKAFCTYVGPESEYYLARKRHLAARGRGISWNWAAFSFTVFWLLYRRMYLSALIIAVAWSADVVPLNVLADRGPIAFALSVPLFVSIPPSAWILFGLFGHYLYVSHVSRQVATNAGRDRSHT